ncbi:MotA/TolQ/ExbB proton channel family protein [Brachyspira hyodysenteriae]|uniref:MotA/TolQ/ExbB proton channel family protein n=1 Tax=Brachyspira hyodysenteriae TaxID=159 RepID=UPI0022CDB8FD|nr:MotA/TolQ/ExbB proton channel family protein [Brachyspira hyodysenteriae]MCZ9840142.1 MotA/TolQ/ExbB proton channel family protein [Brachyspira hyodysenteriae]MCZ9848542.1 MotA/TolQ/ExbB proton channel family protein [Brachyspira hyodysenteriae]MCZ9852210.1 MotA/TolQ/ExbB proton channel family protein [Brachyspira hyodysenteriae]MCZ9861833.1 MotA/TolQ/ExbB proton channel family protein [Brachyspira hyodysenteriae]MCZ9869071.1 MotA/TolQ/ExbB proton channel family protein [Brachyspira hyodyse
MNNIFGSESLLNSAMAICWIGLLISSVLGLTIVVDRFIYFTRIKSQDNSLAPKLISLIKDKELKAAIALCETSKSPLANIIMSGLKNSDMPKESMQSASNKELPRLERFISALSTISTVAPLLGLLGTILGMIQSFAVISVAGSGNPSALASGIANALLTTAAGLIIAIPTVVFYNYFVNTLNERILFIENLSNEVSDYIINESNTKTEN